MRRRRSRVVALLHGRRDLLVYLLVMLLLGFFSLYGLENATPKEKATAGLVEQLCRLDKAGELTTTDLLTRGTSPIYEGSVLLMHQMIDNGDDPISLAALRMPTLFAAILLGVFFFIFICRERSRSIARVSLFFLIATPLFHYYIITGGPAMLGALFGTLALLVCHDVVASKSMHPVGPILLCGILLALAGLSVGFGGVVIPALAVLIWGLLGSEGAKGRLWIPITSIVLAILLVALAAILPGECHWLTNESGRWSTRGLWGCLLTLLPWGVVVLMNEKKHSLRHLSAEGLALLTIISALVYNVASGTSDPTPSLVVAPFICLIAGESFRSLLKDKAKQLTTFSLVINVLGLVVLGVLIFVLTGPSESVSTFISTLSGSEGAIGVAAMREAVRAHMALCLLLMVGPSVAALTMVYQRVRGSETKQAYSSILMVILITLATDLPLLALVGSL
ncbi:glycosyltransferase family 39 protein [uncultured Porphyromonas sp.]|uniref:ArnT family glycosyltransferase n=1 Tax=uncultured Porphyromonas sp. TaxID=159274 RepID=UPI0026086445|nr:hypothetical protein [uncultured Porphyromonas sp.]